MRYRMPVARSAYRAGILAAVREIYGIKLCETSRSVAVRAHRQPSSRTRRAHLASL